MRTLIASTAVCLCLSAAHATVLVNIPFDYAGALPLELCIGSPTTPVNSSALANTRGITGNFSARPYQCGQLTAGAALSYQVSDSSTITGGLAGLNLRKSTNDWCAVAYSPALSGQTLYVRFLYQPDASTARLIVSVGNSGTVDAPAIFTPRFDLNGTASWRCDSINTSQTISSSPYVSGSVGVAGTTYLIVGRLIWNGSGYSTMDMWVNPIYNDGLPPAPNVTAASPGGALFSSLSGPTFRILAGTNTAVSGFVVGTTWSDVIPGAPHVPATYYVATNGNDANYGTNLASPFRTIQKAASLLQAGDTCYIRQGIYRETVTPAVSGQTGAPIIFTAYNGEPVVVSGADVVSLSWSFYSNSIYRASTGLSFRQLFVDGAMMNEARWPNAPVDHLLEAPRAVVMAGNTNTAAYNTDNTFLVDSNLPNVTLVGATAHVFPTANYGYNWAAFTRAITAYDTVAKKISWPTGWSSGGDGSAYRVSPGNRYYLYGALSLLDTPTEWYLGGGTLYLWTPDGASPAAHTVEVKMRATAFVLDNCSYVTVSNLYVFAAGISMNNTLNCVVDNCHLRYVQHNTTADWEHDVNYPISAACTVSGNGSVWRNSSIFISSQDGLQLNGTSAMVTNCVISDVDYYPGSFYACLFPASGSGQKIFRNTLTRAGEGVLQGVQQGARVFPVNYEVAYNDVSWGGYFAQDVGGIYLAFHLDTQGSRIHHNWVHDMCAGNLDNGNSTGIYLDNATTNGIVYRNVAYNNGVGIRMNSPNITNLVYNNTCLQNPLGSIATDNTSSTMAGSRVINNICDSGLTLTSDCTANHNGRYLPVGTNFVPQAGSGAIDGGAILPGYTDGYVGSAPDIGAYESGGTYWTPGANFSIPPFPTPDSTAAPTAPTGLAAAPATDVIGVSLSWTPSPMTVSYYNVRRAGAVGGALTNVAAVIAGTIYTDTNVAAGQTYFYAVSAVNSSGESANSPAITGTPAWVKFMDQADPTGVTSSGFWYTTYVYGSYKLVAENCGPGAGNTTTFTPSVPFAGNCQVFMRWCAYANRATNTPVTVNRSGGASNLTVNQQTNGGAFNYIGTFRFNAGNGGNVVISGNGIPSGTVAIADAVKFVMLPSAAATNLQATAMSFSQISLKWNSLATAASYNVKRSSNNGGPYTVIATGVTGTNYTDAGLSSATPYYYVVSTVSPGGEGANSGQASATTPALPAPGFPLGGISVSGDTVSLVGTGAMGSTYTLWSSTNVTLPLSNWTPLTNATITTSPFTNTDAGATTNQQLFYRFTAP